LSKKTTETIINSKNEYVIGVKGNQKKLLNQAETILSKKENIKDISILRDKKSGRDETRKVSVSSVLGEISKEWKGLKSIIKVERMIKTNKKLTKETAYYISSLALDAESFNKCIRSHWSIENSLHYVKDVVFKEDASTIKSGNSAENFSIVRNIVINIFRKNGLKNTTQTIRLYSNNIHKLCKMTE